VRSKLVDSPSEGLSAPVPTDVFNDRVRVHEVEVLGKKLRRQVAGICRYGYSSVAILVSARAIQVHHSQVPGSRWRRIPIPDVPAKINDSHIRQIRKAAEEFVPAFGSSPGRECARRLWA
jgi:hypothetical protein